MKRRKSTGLSVEDIVAPIAAEISNDRNDLLDFYHWCRTRNRDFFHGMSLAEFEKWNLARIEALDTQPPIETTAQALARLEATVAGMAAKWDRELKALKFHVEPRKVVPIAEAAAKSVPSEGEA